MRCRQCEYIWYFGFQAYCLEAVAGRGDLLARNASWQEMEEEGAVELSDYEVREPEDCPRAAPSGAFLAAWAAGFVE